MVYTDDPDVVLPWANLRILCHINSENYAFTYVQAILKHGVTDGVE